MQPGAFPSPLLPQHLRYLCVVGPGYMPDAWASGGGGAPGRGKGGTGGLARRGAVYNSYHVRKDSYATHCGGYSGTRPQKVF